MMPYTKKLVHTMPARKQQQPSLLVPRKMMMIKIQDDHSQKEIVSKASETCDQKAKISNGATIRIVYRQGVAEVCRIKGILETIDAGKSDSVEIICDMLSKLQYMGLTLNTLEVTGIGKTVRVLQKHPSKQVSQIAGRLMKEWKDVVEEWFKKTNTTESYVVNPTISEEQVMPESVITDQKSRVESDKPNKATGRVTTDQESKKVLVQRRLEATKISTIEEKYETTKRKLQRSYQEAENAKKKRRIQVMELHDLSRYGLLSQLDKAIKPRVRVF